MIANNFNAMTESEKRVTFARDVLWLIQNGDQRLKIELGQYFDTNIPETDVNLDADLRGVLIQSTRQCTGCALGALFYAALMKRNRLTVKDLISGTPGDHTYSLGAERDEILSYLQDFFNREQLDLIEAAFESWSWSAGYTTYYGKLTAHWMPDVREPSERLRLIMEHIVVNNGHFDPGRDDLKPVAIYHTPNFQY